MVMQPILLLSICCFIPFLFVGISATVQAYFRLEQPVAKLIPYIEKLEYDIYSEIGVPDTKVSPQASALVFNSLLGTESDL